MDAATYVARPRLPRQLRSAGVHGKGREVVIAARMPVVKKGATSPDATHDSLTTLRSLSRRNR